MVTSFKGSTIPQLELELFPSIQENTIIMKEGADGIGRERETELSHCLACFPIFHLHLPLQTDFLLHLISFSLSNALITPSEYYRSVLATTPYARSFTSWIILVYNVATISVGAVATATLEKVREKESRLTQEP